MQNHLKNEGDSSYILHRSRRSRRKPLETRQIPLDLPYAKPGQVGGVKCEKRKVLINDTPPRLQIVSVEIDQRVDRERNSYILMIQPAGIRAAAGQYTAEEASEIARATRGWDWSLERDGKPRYLPALERLLDGICKKSAKVKSTIDFPKNASDTEGDPGGGIAESITTEGIAELDPSGELGRSVKNFPKTASSTPDQSIKNFQNQGGES